MPRAKSAAWAAARRLLGARRSSRKGAGVVATLPLHAGSTMRGYDGAAAYTVSSEAQALARAIAADYGLQQVAAWPIAVLRVHCLVYRLPAGDARGWITRPETWAGGTTTIAHEGSNTLWHAIAVAAPDKGLGFFVLSNGGLEGRSAAVPLIRVLIAARTG